MTGLRIETNTAIAAVRESLEIAKLGTRQAHAKIGRDVVTDTDVVVEDHLRSSLTTQSGWPVIGEERGGEIPDEDAPYWLVDPICGTRNYASGIPLYAVNVAFVEQGRVSISVVGDGSSGDLLVAEAGRGARRVRPDGIEPLTTSAETLTVDYEAWPKQEPELGRAMQLFASAVQSDRWNVRSFSTTLSLAYVATGQLAGCVLFSSSDKVHVAAGSLLVAQAGGPVTDFAGRAWTLSSKSLVCSANDDIHKEILDLLGNQVS